MLTLLLLVAANGCYTQLAPRAADYSDEPAPVALQGTWEWVRLETPAETVVVEFPERYSLTMGGLHHATVVVDCNSGRARSVTVEENRIAVGPMATTKRGCGAGSLDRPFRAAMAQAETFVLEGDSLYLSLAEGGRMVLRRR